jgi:hypothetical protein
MFRFGSSAPDGRKPRAALNFPDFPDFQCVMRGWRPELNVDVSIPKRAKLKMSWAGFLLRI